MSLKSIFANYQLFSLFDTSLSDVCRLALSSTVETFTASGAVKQIYCVSHVQPEVDTPQTWGGGWGGVTQSAGASNVQ